MFVFHRIDDVYACRPDLMQVLAATESAGVPTILGVIPQRLTAEMAAYLSARPHFVIYQHGVDHKSRAVSGSKDEFPATRDRSDVAASLAEGHAALVRAVGRPVHGYIPPWNVTAPATLEILATLGFTHISAKRTYGPGVRLAALPIAVDTLSSYAPPTARSADAVMQLIAQERRRAPAVPVGLVYHIKDLPDDQLAGIVQVIERSAAFVPPASVWGPFAGA